MENNSSSNALGAIGSMLAFAFSYAKWHSFCWAIFHFFCGWVYVFYYIFTYGFPVIPK